MNAGPVTTMAKEEMKKFGLMDDGWKFKLSRANTQFGVCQHGRKTIKVSKLLASVNDPLRVRNTILHEIAHAIVGFEHHHDEVWRAKAIEIGCDGKRCVDEGTAVFTQGKLLAICPNCKKESRKFRMPKRLRACGKCCDELAGGQFDRRFLLTYTKETA